MALTSWESRLSACCSKLSHIAQVSLRMYDHVLLGIYTLWSLGPNTALGKGRSPLSTPTSLLGRLPCAGQTRQPAVQGQLSPKLVAPRGLGAFGAQATAGSGRVLRVSGAPRLRALGAVGQATCSPMAWISSEQEEPGPGSLPFMSGSH